ncbi:MAG: ATP-dependent helicase [Dehalococcoidia bacterium]
MAPTESPATFVEGLNPPQRGAVTHEGGPVLVLAGPGSGKTRVITQRIAYLVREMRVAPWRICAVTFTNKAAREMRDRAERVLGEDARSLTLGTFHSLCARWLRVDGEKIGIDPNYVIYDDADQVALMKRVLEDLRVDPRRFPPRSILSAISNAKSELIVPAEYKRGVKEYFEEVVAQAYERYQAALKNASAMDFDDLLNEAVRLFRESDEAREKYAGRFLHVLVDEFQDTNPVQYSLSRQLASKHGNIMVVGDPDQSIYSWRAADVRNIGYFERDFPGSAVYLLEQNYRSTQPILTAADSVIAKNPDRKPRRLWTDRPGGDLITLYEAYSDEEEGEFIAGEVSRLRAGGRDIGGIAVLYRTNAQSRAVEDALIRHRIPYRLVGGVRFYQRREIKDLIAYMRLIHNRLDEASLLRVVNVPGRGIGDKTMERVREHAQQSGLAMWDVLDAAARGVQVPGVAGRALSGIREFVVAIDGLRAMRQGELLGLFDAMLAATTYRTYLSGANDPESEERLENVDQLRAVVGQYEDVGGESDLAQFLNDVALVADVDELQNTASAVTLITLHAAKGLEFPAVFLIGMEEGVLPHIRSFDDPRQMEEERRLAYVGMTRAMDLLYLTRAYRRYAMGSSSMNPASRFIADIPKSLLRNYGSAAKAGAAERSAPRTYVEAVIDAPALPAAAAGEAAFAAGDMVRHRSFGVGKVISVSKNGGDIEYQVTFDTAGTKRLLQSYAKLVEA